MVTFAAFWWENADVSKTEGVCDMIHISELIAKKMVKGFTCEHEISKDKMDYIFIKLKNNTILAQLGRSSYRPSLASRFYHN